MRTILIGLTGFLLGAASAVYFVIQSENTVSTQNIDKDLGEVAQRVEEADAEGAKYGGGLIVNFIQLRRAIYEETKAILLQKRMAYIHRINLDLAVSGAGTPADGADLKALEREIEGIRSEIKAAELEAARYSGGLILSLIQMRKAQQESTLASLEQARLVRRYGLHLPELTQTKSAPSAPVDLDDPKAKGAL